MRLCSIASGSSGNCIYVGSEDHHILIDAGLSGRRIEEGLNALGISGDDLDGILISHEHSDHIKGLGVAARKYGVPIYATRGTAEAIRETDGLGFIDPDLFVEVRADEDFQIGDLKISPFYISHDAAEPVNYRVSSGEKSVAVATDLGVYTDYTVEKLKGVNALLLEANHDIRMLEAGSYPYPLKLRISGDLGHLSNETAGKLLCRLLHSDMKAVLLGHLSKENNYPELAYETVKLEVQLGDTPFNPGDFKLGIAGRDKMSECIEV